MSLRQKLLQIKADWEKWEDRLSIAVAVFFAAAIAANVGLFFSVRKTPSFFGAAFSWLYAVSWFPAAILLRNRAKRVRAVSIVRWTAVGGCNSRMRRANRPLLTARPPLMAGRR